MVENLVLKSVGHLDLTKGNNLAALRASNSEEMMVAQKVFLKELSSVDDLVVEKAALKAR